MPVWFRKREPEPTAEARIAREMASGLGQLLRQEQRERDVRAADPVACCRNCRWRREAECRRAPPRFVEDHTHYEARWPVVAPSDWCGEHARQYPADAEGPAP